jgi:hypothetical protein
MYSIILETMYRSGDENRHHSSYQVRPGAYAISQSHINVKSQSSEDHSLGSLTVPTHQQP